MNDRIKKSFIEWLTDIEKNQILGELAEILFLGDKEPIETNEPNPECEDGPEVILELDEGGFFNPF